MMDVMMTTVAVRRAKFCSDCYTTNQLQHTIFLQCDTVRALKGDIMAVII